MMRRIVVASAFVALCASLAVVWRHGRSSAAAPAVTAAESPPPVSADGPARALPSTSRADRGAQLGTALVALARAREVPPASSTATETAAAAKPKLDFVFGAGEDKGHELEREQLRDYMSLRSRFNDGKLSRDELAAEMARTDALIAAEMRTALTPERYAVWDRQRAGVQSELLRMALDEK
jgi:hypothetical protein